MRKIRIIQLVVLVSLLFSCKTNHRVVSHPRCVEKSKKVLIGYWFYYPEKDIYSEGKGTLHLMHSKKFQRCVKHLHRRDLEKIFGVPNEVVDKKMYYRYSQGTIAEGTLYVGMYIKLTKENYFESIHFFFVG